MATADVQALQNAINRFAQMAGFSMVPISGVVDATTANAFLRAMQIVQQDVPDEADNAATFIATASDPTSITNSAAGYAIYLGQQADYLNLPGTATPPTLTSVASATIPGAPLSTNVSLIWNSLPTVLKVGLGLALGAAAIGVAHHLHKKKGGRGLRGIDLANDAEFDGDLDAIN